MKAIKSLLILLVLLGAHFAHAVHYGLELGARSYVRGASARLHVAEDGLIWGQKNSEQDWRFGLYKLQAGASTHGQLDASISLYPISFFEINYQKKWTQRYSAPSNFECVGIQCYGAIERDIVQAKLALAYKQLLGVLSYSRQWTKARNTNESIFDELENILMLQNTDSAEIKSIFLGLKVNTENNLVMGLAARNFEYELSKIRNELVGVAVSRDLKWQEKTFKVLGLVGLYRSDYSREGLSVALAAQYTWGEAPLALF
jgi:hypothetical protein